MTQSMTNRVRAEAFQTGGGIAFRSGDAKVLAFCALLLATIVVAGNVFLVSVSDVANLGEFRAELIGFASLDPPPNWIEGWFWHQEAPYKYRVLGKVPVWCFYQSGLLLGMQPERALYGAYLLSCGLCLGLALYWLGGFLRTFLIEAGADPLPEAQAMIPGAGMLLFCMAAPVMLFSKLPVHGSPNDFLGYALMARTAQRAAAGRLGQCVMAAMLAALCRETTLLAPFLVLFIGRIPFRARVLPAFSAGVVLLAMRWRWPGFYNPIEAAGLNFDVPLQTLAFLFLTFGPLWFLAVPGFIRLRRLSATDSDGLSRALVVSSPWALILTLTVTLLFARVREIRILFVLFLYIFPFAMFWLYTGRQRLRAWLRSGYFLLWILICAVIAFRIRVALMPTDVAGHQQLASVLGVMFTGFIEDHRFNWISVTIGNVFALFLCLPLLMPIRDNDASRGSGGALPV